MSYRLVLAACLCFGLVGCAAARDPQLQLPDFGHLRGKATDTVDITLGSFAFFVARHVIDDADAQSAAAKDILKGVSSMRIRHYEFAEDFVYSKSDLDNVRSQLTTRGWNAIAHVQDRKKNENVDVYVAVEKEKITGFAFVASEPREFTIVNIVGSLDPKQVAVLHEKLTADSSAALSQIGSNRGGGERRAAEPDESESSAGL